MDKLEVLHDHYKESFSYIREDEKRRNRLFLLVLALLGVLVAFAYYPKILESVSEVEIASVKIDPMKIRMDVLLSLVWTLILVFTLQHAQLTVGVVRKYKYLHDLEKLISKAHFEDKAYYREGRAYKDEYPALSWFAWKFYVVIFPLIVIAAVILVCRNEWVGWKRILEGQRIYHYVVALLVLLTMLLKLIRCKK